jgi:hypothetical protein
MTKHVQCSHRVLNSNLLQIPVEDADDVAQECVLDLKPRGHKGGIGWEEEKAHGN